MAVAGTVLLLVSSCTTGSVASRESATSTTTTSVTQVHYQSTEYQSPEVRFAHPVAWTATHFDEVSTFTDSIVYLSNQAMMSPCTTTYSKRGETVSCGWAIHHLNANGVMVEWSAVADPGGPGRTVPGRSIKVGGLPAHEVTDTADTCGIGASESVSITVARKFSTSSFYDMMACLRGPELGQEIAEVQDMISSTTFPNG